MVTKDPYPDKDVWINSPVNAYFIFLIFTFEKQ